MPARRALRLCETGVFSLWAHMVFVPTWYSISTCPRVGQKLTNRARCVDARYHEGGVLVKREAEGGKVMSDVATVAVVVAIAILTLVNVFIAVR